VTLSRASVERQRDVIVGVLDAIDEIGEMIGAGNRSDDACGDNAQFSSRIGREGERIVAKRRACEMGHQAIARLFFWL